MVDQNTIVERPIILTDILVDEMINGRKTQTRQIIKSNQHGGLFSGDGDDSSVLDPINDEWRQREVGYSVGDRLWIQEDFTFSSQVFATGHYCEIQYLDGAIRELHPTSGDIPKEELPTYFRMWDRAAKAKNCSIGVPAIQMPRWACRIKLEVTDVRVQRLQDINKEDAMAEGMTWPSPLLGVPRAADSYFDPAASFCAFWNSIHGPDAWDANPWVAALTFRGWSR
ncbi:hypothetical protein [Aestuariivirga sp.]|uniref:hypothetical protein n=1 Tax=Aestuariivirga sp. TaxID=2650926 RepID=UPI003BAB9E9B